MHATASFPATGSLHGTGSFQQHLRTLSLLGRRCLSFPAMLTVALAASPFFASLDVQQGTPVMRDPDIWWHLRNAQELFATHRFLHADLYSFTTHGQPWINPEWLAEVPYFLAWRVFSDRGIFLVMLLLVELILWATFWRSYRRSGEVASSFLATWVAVLMATVNIGPRTILFGWLCFVIQLIVLDEFRRGRDWLWTLVPLYVFWVNLHPTWFIGLAFYAVYAGSGVVAGSWGSIEAQRWTPVQARKLLVVGVMSAFGLLLNPYGWHMVVYPFQFMFRQPINVGVIEEWRPLDFQSFHGIFLFVVIAALLFFTLVERRSWPLYEFLFALAAVYAGVEHMRFLFLTGIILAPILVLDLRGRIFSPYDPARDRYALNALAICGFLAFCFWHVPSSRTLRAAEADYFPVKAIPALRSSCTGHRMFNQFEWGGYLDLNVPEIPVFIDSRNDVFEYHGVFADHLRILGLNDSEGLLGKYDVQCVLVNPDSSLVADLSQRPDWSVHYHDNVSVLLVRTQPFEHSTLQAGTTSSRARSVGDGEMTALQIPSLSSPTRQ